MRDAVLRDEIYRITGINRGYSKATLSIAEYSLRIENDIFSNIGFIEALNKELKNVELKNSIRWSLRDIWDTLSARRIIDAIKSASRK